MVSESTRDTVFACLLEETANHHCFDCNAESAWVSLSFAVFLCTQCAETHGQQGFEVKRITSEWSVRQLRLIKAGGNEALAAALREGETEEEMSAESKYRTGAAQHYRLRLTAEGREMKLPSKDTGTQLSPPLQVPSPTTTTEGVKGLLNRAVSASRDAGGKLLSGLGSSVAVQSMDSSAKAALSSVEGAVSQTIVYQMAKETASSAARSLGESAKGLYHRFWRSSNPSQ